MREQLQQQADDYHATQFVPVDMPHDAEGNIFHESGNFFQSAQHSDGLPKPRHARAPRHWDSLVIDPVLSLLSTPTPVWQHPATRFGLVNRVYAGTFYKLGYRGHCHACDGYFMTWEWAQGHECSMESKYRDYTKREECDYPALRKAAKKEAEDKAKYDAQHRGILSALKRVIFRVKG